MQQGGLNMIIQIYLSKLSFEPPTSSRCPYCGSQQTRRHQLIRNRDIVEFKFLTFTQIRLMCKKCRRTFTLNPKGLKKGKHRSQRVIAFGILLYALGLPYRKVASILRTWVGTASASTIYEDVRKAGTEVRALHHKHTNLVVKVRATDQVLQEVEGQRKQDGAALSDTVEGIILDVKLKDKKDERGVKQFIEKLRRRYGIEAYLMNKKKGNSR
jgi:transposase-like protein